MNLALKKHNNNELANCCKERMNGDFARNLKFKSFCNFIHFFVSMRTKLFSAYSSSEFFHYVSPSIPITL
ncbi:hypothetical protein CW304_13755 [Bacillus sp. UFRGS-B20]|nr:hypothetical protein CW304_13755 [Bacillus sp. UFRGS-B20]